jgi:hypothetical protein
MPRLRRTGGSTSAKFVGCWGKDSDMRTSLGGLCHPLGGGNSSNPLRSKHGKYFGKEHNQRRCCSSNRLHTDQIDPKYWVRSSRVSRPMSACSACFSFVKPWINVVSRLIRYRAPAASIAPPCAGVCPARAEAKGR